MLRIGLAMTLAAVFAASAQDTHISGDKIREHVKYLASDELEGRGVGTHGEKLATEYIASQLRTEGLKPEHVAPMAQHVQRDSAAVLFAVIPGWALWCDGIAFEDPVTKFSAHREYSTKEADIAQRS